MSATNYQQGIAQLNDYRQQIAALRERMRDVQGTLQPEPVRNYVFDSAQGPLPLSEMFAGHRDLIVIHNMGQACAYCTLWADGFNGVYEQLRQRAALVVTSPDSVAEQQTFARSRDWRFAMASHAGTSFAEDMGYGSVSAGWEPGVSVFQHRDDQLVRVSDANLGPWDDFCPLWHLFDLLPDGVDGFVAQNTYA